MSVNPTTKVLAHSLNRYSEADRAPICEDQRRIDRFFGSPHRFMPPVSYKKRQATNIKNRLPIAFMADTATTSSRRRAEGEGFEPTEPCGSTVVKTAAFNHFASPPNAAHISTRPRHRRKVSMPAAHPNREPSRNTVGLKKITHT